MKKPRNVKRRGSRGKSIASGALAAVWILFAALFLSLCPAAGEEGIYHDVIRLHILAASDDAGDQADKIAVRDAILSEYGDLFRTFADREAAEAALDRDLLERIGETARQTLAGRGRDLPVTVTLSEEDYPTREYGSVSLPAGRYLSLRVVLGEGNGQNWWCVLFPPLCTAASVEGVPLGLSDAEYRLLTDGKKSVRFKTLELLSRWFGD